ncbi:MAG: hypothetical protein WED07_00045 [Candidatus Freyarchaeum deiterrae]
MPTTVRISAFALSVIFAILLFFGIIFPVLTIQTTLFGTIVDSSFWFSTLEGIICIVAFIVTILGVFLSFSASEYAIAEGLTIFGSTTALVTSFLFLIRRIGGTTNLQILNVPSVYYYYYYQGQWQYSIMFNNIPVYLSTLQIPLGPIITCFSAFVIVIIFFALLGGYLRK